MVCEVGRPDSAGRRRDSPAATGYYRSIMLRWGILGCARINRSLLPAFAASERNSLVAIASRSPAKAEEAARAAGIPRALAPYEALIELPDLDAVYIPLPNSLHAEWTIRALSAGKHVLCEKPMVLRLSELDRIARAVRETGRLASEAFMYRHHPQTLRVRELVAEGAIGTPRLVKGSFSFDLDREGDVRFDPALGGGSLWDVGCYPVSYARTVLAEEPERAFGWQATGPTGVDLTFVGQLRFPSGALAQFDCSFEAPFRTRIEIVGSRGTLTVPRPFKPGAAEALTLRRGDREETIPVAGPELYLGELEDLADAALLGRPPRISLADTRANTATLVALYRSAREGRPVAVADAD
jgi:xylose dehydrogenase (NAD/NADP)